MANAITLWRLGASRSEIRDSLETALQLSLNEDEVEVRSDED